MERLKWTDRNFQFDIPVGWMPNVLGRLAGAPLRIRAIVLQVPEASLIHKPNGKWSINEHIGHLVDLEELHTGRIDDFEARKTELRAADMKNIKTEAGNHNMTPIDTLIAEFERGRNHFIHRLRALPEAVQTFESLHPRLNVGMKPVDMATFTTEHDDHHIASIYEILESLK